MNYQILFLVVIGLISIAVCFPQKLRPYSPKKFLTLYKVAQFNLPFYPFWSFRFLLFLAVYIVTVVLLNVDGLLYRLDYSVDDSYQRFGYMALCHFAISPFFALRIISPLALFGFKRDVIIQMHSFLSTMAVFWTLLHGSLYFSEWMQYKIVYYEIFQQVPNKNMYGIAATSILLLVLLTSQSIFRKYAFWLFQLIHWVSYPILFWLIYVHSKRSLPYLLPGIVAFGLDLLIRFVMLGRQVVSSHLVQIEDIYKISLTPYKPIKCRPGQYFLLHTPFLELHPLSSVSQELDFVIYSKSNLRRKFDRMSTFRFDGPYGTSFDGVLDCDNIVLIAGGIGITPILSILKAVKMQNVQVYWTVKNLSLVSSLKEELEEAIKRKSVKVKVYVTGLDGLDSEFKGYLDVQYYRPDFVELIKEFKGSNPYENISVGVCGPDSIGRDVQKASRLYSDKEGVILAYLETFAL